VPGKAEYLATRLPEEFTTNKGYTTMKRIENALMAMGGMIVLITGISVSAGLLFLFSNMLSDITRKMFDVEISSTVILYGMGVVVVVTGLLALFINDNDEENV
jgi:uncharacterized PurR-regulated membrane protein YhhQ (DUF165 family)